MGCHPLLERTWIHPRNRTTFCEVLKLHLLLRYLGYPTNWVTSDFDALFHQSWKATTDRCKKDLENDELAVALQVKSLSDFIARLESQHGPGNESQLEVLYLLPFALTHYDTFATMFVKMMKRNVDVSLMWGLLYLVIKVDTIFKSNLR